MTLAYLQIGCSRCSEDISGYYDDLDPPYYCAACLEEIESVVSQPSDIPGGTE